MDAILPSLLVAITRDGQLVRHIKIPDPRNAFCREFNLDRVNENLQAVPVASTSHLQPRPVSPN